MKNCLRRLAVALVLLGAAPAFADEPKQKEQKPEAIPAPKASAPSVITIMPIVPQPGTREIWQNYRVDGRGRFVPRVMYHPEGSFNLRTGEPYPWTTTRPLLHMPYVLD